MDARLSMDAVADELYGLPPDEFTARRNALAKQARDAGDRRLADSVRALAKPTLAAWLTNQLVRRHRDEITELLRLGADLRDATAGLQGEQLVALSQQEQRLVRALVEQARSLARAAGRPVSDDASRAVEDTLRAALADPAVADEVAAARLSAPLAHVGFFGAGGSTSVQRPPRAATVDAQPGDIDRARTDVADASDRLRQARDELAGAAAAAADRDATVDRLEARLDDLRRQLAEVSGAHAAARDEQRRARGDHDRAGTAVGAAERRLHDAEERLHRLADVDSMQP